MCDSVSDLRRIGENLRGQSTQEEMTVVLEAHAYATASSRPEAYDFGGQDVYYAMHHLFLSDAGARILLKEG